MSYHDEDSTPKIKVALVCFWNPRKELPISDRKSWWIARCQIKVTTAIPDNAVLNVMSSPLQQKQAQKVFPHRILTTVDSRQFPPNVKCVRLSLFGCLKKIIQSSLATRARHPIRREMEMRLPSTYVTTSWLKAVQSARHSRSYLPSASSPAVPAFLYRRMNPPPDGCLLPAPFASPISHAHSLVCKNY